MLIIQLPGDTYILPLSSATYNRYNGEGFIFSSLCLSLSPYKVRVPLRKQGYINAEPGDRVETAVDLVLSGV